MEQHMASWTVTALAAGNRWSGIRRRRATAACCWPVRLPPGCRPGRSLDVVPRCARDDTFLPSPVAS